MSKPIKHDWRAYNELAWVDSVLVSPADCAEETEYFVKTIRDHSRIPVKTMLHLGCGAGMNDYTFKKHFAVTGVDVSAGMLKTARKLNPEVRYIRGDMRDIRLRATFDAVAIPDSIGYMTTLKDLGKAIRTAHGHLNPGGTLLIVALLREDFRENNFVYAGERGDVAVTVFENNRSSRSGPALYEATIVYLIRRRGALRIVSERHALGLFPAAAWMRLLAGAGFSVKRLTRKHSYDRFMQDNGEYLLRVFACRKP